MESKTYEISAELVNAAMNLIASSKNDKFTWVEIRTVLQGLEQLKEIGEQKELQEIK